MARALSTQVKEFLDMWLATTPQRKQIVYSHNITYSKYPYLHEGKFSRKYDYHVKDGFQLITATPFNIDLMGNPWTSMYMKELLKEMNGSDCEGLNQYKQIVLHYETYTGLIELESGTENVVLEINVKKDMC